MNFAVGCTALLALAVVAHADSDASHDAPTPRVVFYAMAARADGAIRLANGRPVDPRDWRTLMLAKVGTQQLADGTEAPITCTGTLIGPGGVLTAAHCLDGGPGVGLATTAGVAVGGDTYIADCSVAAPYRDAVAAKVWRGRVPRVPQDYALCRFKQPDPAPKDLSDLSYEVVEISTALNAGDAALLTGFGCSAISIDADGAVHTAGFDHKFRVGDARIAAKQAGDPIDYLTVLSGTKEPTLCPGDSGGPLLSGASAKNQTVPRRVRGVNSAVGPVADDAQGKRFVSQVAALAAHDFSTFKDAWLSTHTDALVCGVTAAAGAPPCAR